MRGVWSNISVLGHNRRYGKLPEMVGKQNLLMTNAEHQLKAHTRLLADASLASNTPNLRADPYYLTNAPILITSQTPNNVEQSKHVRC